MVALAAGSASRSSSRWRQREALSLRVLLEVGGASAGSIPPSKPRLLALGPASTPASLSSRPPAQSAALGPAKPALVRPVAAEGDPSEPLRPPTGNLRGSETRPVAIVSGPHGLAPAGRRFPSSSSGREGSQSAKPGWLEEVAAEAEGGALLPGRHCFSSGGGCGCRWLQKGGGSRVPGHGEEIRTRGHRELLSCSSGHCVDT